MEHRVLRTFHPVGQGAFYSERHSDFNIVYDCGSMPLLSNTKSVVKSAFNKSDVIDVLFISHFDYDHVSAISVLVNSVSKIERVVLPLLHDEHKNLLININRALSQNIVKLLKDPQSFFGEKTDIIYVKAAPPEENIENSETSEREQFDLREIRQRISKASGRFEIDSGSILSIGNIVHWVFVPYNFCNANRSYQLESRLKAAGFDIDQLKNSPSYGLTEFTTPQSRKTLRSIYSRVDGNVNENSMLLYSGPGDTVKNRLWWNCDDECSLPICWFERPGCIYTGDSDLNKIDILSKFSEFERYIGTIQVPHHGSRHNFSIAALNEYWSPIFCPISFGTKNRYGHPATEVINQLAAHRHIPLLITEEPNTVLVQKFSSVDKKLKSLEKALGKF